MVTHFKFLNSNPVVQGTGEDGGPKAMETSAFTALFVDLLSSKVLASRIQESMTSWTEHIETRLGQFNEKLVEPGLGLRLKKHSTCCMWHLALILEKKRAIVIFCVE